MSQTEDILLQKEVVEVVVHEIRVAFVVFENLVQLGLNSIVRIGVDA